jgi:putative phosphonate catabolism associated alcohol dehydrogenase
MIRAALYDGHGRLFRIEAMPRPKLEPGECLVRIDLATVCGSDRHTHAGHRPANTPCILGHEAVGTIEELNGLVHSLDGHELRIGDRVVWSVAVHCNECFFCIHDLPQKCVRLKKYGKERHDERRGPSGCLATHVQLWKGTPIVRVPLALPSAVAAPAMCATATVLAMLRCVPGLRSGADVLITGAGMLGVTTIARLRDANIVLVDRNADRLRLAERFGTVQSIAAEEPFELRPPRGFDAAFELTGSNAMAELCIENLRVGGTAVLAGAVYPTGLLKIDHQRIVRDCLTIHGIHNYAPHDLQSAVAWLAESHHEFPFDELVAPPRPLEEVDAAFADARFLRASIAPNR